MTPSQVERARRLEQVCYLCVRNRTDETTEHGVPVCLPCREDLYVASKKEEEK